MPSAPSATPAASPVAEQVSAEERAAPAAPAPTSSGTALTKVTPVWNLRPLPVPLAPVPSVIVKPMPVLTPSVHVGDGTSSSVQEVASVEVMATLSGLKGEHELTMEVITPTQATFERRSQALKGGASDLQHVRFQLPVAGTLIQTANLTGMWSARFLLDGTEIAAHDFELTP